MKTLVLNGKSIPVASIEEARQRFRTWIDQNDYGNSDLRRGAGDVLEGGTVVAHISYNGRVWAPGEEMQELATCSLCDGAHRVVDDNDREVRCPDCASDRLEEVTF